MTEIVAAAAPAETSSVTESRLRRLLDISVALNAVTDLDELLCLILTTACEVLDCEASSILLYDEMSRQLRFAAATGEDIDALAAIPVPLYGSLAGLIFRENRHVLAEDVSLDARHYAVPASAVGFQPRVLLGVPMRIDGEPVGVLEALNPCTAASFTESDIEHLSIISAQAAIATRNARQQLALRQANGQLADLDRLKSNVIAVASHELRTPLAAIQGYSQLLRDEAEEGMQTHVSALLAGTERMTEVVSAMEQMSALGAGDALLTKAPIVLQDVLRTVHAEADTSRDVRLDVPENPLVVFGDRDALETVFRHILDNALAFTPDDGEVILYATSNGTAAFACVRDTGRGLAAADLDSVFDAFYQVADPLTRDRDGLGLGLTIAHTLVDRHNGLMWAESGGLGHGSTFHVRLPLHWDAAA